MTVSPAVLILDDDAELRGLLTEQLGGPGGFAVVQAGRVSEAEALLAAPRARFGAAILDVGLPDGDGRDLCASLRRRRFAMPILMLSGMADAEADVVRGLEAGASDYLAKPFRMAELLARLRAQMRAHETSDDAAFPLGRFTFHPAAGRLHEAPGGRRVRLSATENRILRRLCRAGGAVVSRRALTAEIWGGATPAAAHRLDTHVWRLRQKLEPEARRPRLLLTKGDGYHVRADDTPEAMPPGAAAMPSTGRSCPAHAGATG